MVNEETVSNLVKFLSDWCSENGTPCTHISFNLKNGLKIELESFSADSLGNRIKNGHGEYYDMETRKNIGIIIV